MACDFKYAYEEDGIFGNPKEQSNKIALIF